MTLLNKILYSILALILFVVVVQIVAADRYQAVVNIVEEEGKVGVNPTGERLDYGDLSKNSSAIRYVTMKNSGSFKIYVWALKFGNIADLIDIHPNQYVLKPGEEVKMNFQITIPPSVNRDSYKGWVMIMQIPSP